MSEVLEKIENEEKENNIQAQEQEKEALADFYGEIQELKEKEETGELKTVHFKNINVAELTAEDMGMWEKFKNKKITADDIDDYREKLWQENGENKEKIPESRLQFVAFLGNQVCGLIFERNKFKKESLKKAA